MVPVLWEIVLPLLVAFVVGWVVMGWLTWRWRRPGVGELRVAEVSAELDRTRTRLVEATAKVADLEAAAVAPAPAPPKPPPLEDDLTAIRGVGKKMEAKLGELGITSLRQVAAFTDEEIERVSAGIGAFPGRIERDRWVAQAKELVDRLPDEPAD